jgi:prepilin signal peptidase PulO-like enzyme (type II secretory pathway)
MRDTRLLIRNPTPDAFDSEMPPSRSRVGLPVVLVGAVAGSVLSIVVPGPWPDVGGTAQAMMLGALLLAAADCDLRTGRIPNSLTGFGAAGAAGLLLVAPEPGPVYAVLGCVAAVLLLLGVRGAGTLFFGRPGMGMGDVKLAAVLGLIIGPEVVWGLYLAILFGGLGAAAAFFRRRPMGGRTLAFAPFVGMGTVCALYVIPFHALRQMVLMP